MFAIAGTLSVGAGLPLARGTPIRLRSGQAVRYYCGRVRWSLSARWDSVRCELIASGYVSRDQERDPARDRPCLVY